MSATPPDPRAEGFWQRDVVHCPRPLSPLMTSAILPLIGQASRWWFADIGGLPLRLDWREIGGWVYLRRVDPDDVEAARLRSIDRADHVVTHDLAGENLTRWHRRWRPELEARTRALRATDRRRLDDTALGEHFDDAIALQADALGVHFRVHAIGTVALGDLRRTTRELLDWDDAMTLALLEGTASDVRDLARSIEDLASIARGSPRVRALVEQGIVPVAPVDPGVVEFLATLSRHLDRFGHRTPGYELAERTAIEDPASTLRRVRAHLTHTGGGPGELLERPPSRSAAASAMAAARETVPASERDRLDRVLARARAVYPLREECGPVTWTEPLAVVRYVALEIGRRAQGRGHLDAVDDVFWLDHHELRSAAGGTGPDPAAVAARRTRAARTAASAPAPTLGENPGPPRTDDLPSPARWINESLLWLVGRMLEPTRLRAAAEPEHDLTGVAASRGVAGGPVRILREHDDLDAVRPGDVLVCRTLSAAWSAVLPIVGALVADSGGTLSHGAIIAREFGCPAVVATGNATDVLRNGQHVLVDGDNGIVRLRGSRDDEE